MAFEFKGQLRSDPTSCSITDWLASLLSNTFLSSLNFVKHKIGTKKTEQSANSIGQWMVQVLYLEILQLHRQKAFGSQSVTKIYLRN